MRNLKIEVVNLNVVGTKKKRKLDEEKNENGRPKVPKWLLPLIEHKGK